MSPTGGRVGFKICHFLGCCFESVFSFSFVLLVFEPFKHRFNPGIYFGFSRTIFSTTQCPKFPVGITACGSAVTQVFLVWLAGAVFAVLVGNLCHSLVSGFRKDLAIIIIACVCFGEVGSSLHFAKFGFSSWRGQRVSVMIVSAGVQS